MTKKMKSKKVRKIVTWICKKLLSLAERRIEKRAGDLPEEKVKEYTDRAACLKEELNRVGS